MLQFDNPASQQNRSPSPSRCLACDLYTLRSLPWVLNVSRLPSQGSGQRPAASLAACLCAGLRRSDYNEAATLTIMTMDIAWYPAATVFRVIICYNTMAWCLIKINIVVTIFLVMISILIMIIMISGQSCQGKLLEGQPKRAPETSDRFELQLSARGQGLGLAFRV